MHYPNKTITIPKQGAFECLFRFLALFEFDDKDINIFLGKHDAPKYHESY
jgi:hypothetical protein